MLLLLFLNYLRKKHVVLLPRIGCVGLDDYDDMVDGDDYMPDG